MDIANKLKVLIIAKSFPPLVSAQALQAVKIAEALHSADVVVHVVAGIDPKDLLLGQAEKEKHEFQLTFISKKATSTSKSKLINSLGRVYKEINQVNQFSQWIKDAYNVTKEIFHNFNPDIILSQSTPFDSHIVAFKLKQKYNVKWVASFSDPYPIYTAPAPYNRTYKIPLFSIFQIMILKKILNEVDTVHVPSKYIPEFMERATNLYIRDKVYTIPHIGNVISRPRQSKNGLLVHIGSLNKERVSIELLSAIKKFAQCYPQYFDGMMCVGKCCQKFVELVKIHSMEKLIRFRGSVTPEVATELAQEAHVLLVIEAKMDQSPFLPSKFADYAITQRPILAITPEKSAMSDFLNYFKGGIAVTHDSKKIFNALEILFLKNNQDAIFNCNQSNLNEVFFSNNVGQQYLSMLKQL